MNINKLAGLQASKPVPMKRQEAELQPQQPQNSKSRLTAQTQPALEHSQQGLEQKIETASPQKMQAQSLELGSHLQRQDGSLNLLKDMLQAPQNKNESARFLSVKRDSQELRRSGILDDLQVLPECIVDQKSELYRGIEDDSREVLQGLRQMTPEQIDGLKREAFKHPEVNQDLQASIDAGYYGSEPHKQYGALVETLTAGIISAEEAMGMNPSGGIPGAGMDKLPLISEIGAVARHALRHDATGFLLSRFQVGPGYGTPTTPVLGMDKDNQYGGQWLGILREACSSSIFPDTSHVGKPLFYT